MTSLTSELEEVVERGKKCLRRLMVNAPPGWGTTGLTEIEIGDVWIKRDTGVWAVSVLMDAKSHLLYCETPSGEHIKPPGGHIPNPGAVQKALLTLRQHMVLDDLAGV